MRKKPATAPKPKDIVATLQKVADDIWQTPATPGISLSFLPQLLVLTGMPHRDPGEDSWIRRNGDVALYLDAGKVFSPDGKKRVSIGLPYGVYPRLLNEYLTTYVVRTGSREIPLGDSFRQFEDLLGIDKGGKSDKQLFVQAQRFMKATIGWEGRVSKKDLGRVEVGEELKTVERRNLFFDPDRPDQPGLWASSLLLTERYFRCINQFRVPMDHRAYRALARTGSSLAMDLLAWMSLRTYELPKKTDLIDWHTLQNQFGGGYNLTKNFAQAFKRAFKLVKPFHDGRVEFERGGIVLHPKRRSLVPTKLPHPNTTPSKPSQDEIPF